MESASEVTATPEFHPTITGSDLHLTEAAVKKLDELFADADEGLTGIRVFVSGGGCSGMTYGMTFTDAQSEYDCVLDGGGFKLYVDAVAVNYLRGAEIDFVDRPTGASFVFNNVFAATGGSGACGACGSSSGGCA